ncbi:MAG: TIGR00341 family protein [Bryobacterales bacterium]
MALRLIEATVPDDRVERAREALAAEECLASWSYDLDDEHTVVAVVLRAEEVESRLDKLGDGFEGYAGFRAMVYAVEAMLPRPEEKPKDHEEDRRQRDRISREELYARISDGADLDRTFLLQVFLSTTVAVIGLLRNDLAVIIGAMVIAPLLGPNVSLALATVLSDAKLGLRAVRTNLAGVGLAIGLSILVGMVLPVDPGSPALAARTRVGLEDLALATASGAAGVLAFTTGVPASLIGVMVAVALLPPAAVFGLLIGGGDFQSALQALLLLTVNVISVNLAAVAMFAVKGVQPRHWWEAGRARSATRNAIVVWSLLLLSLALLIALSERLPG